MYLSNTNVPAGTKTKLPAIKYTPSSICTADPWPVGTSEVGLTFAYSVGEPLLDNSSPPVNFWLVLLLPESIYFTYNVFGSLPSAATTERTFALTPELPPVIVVPTKLFR